MASDSQIRVGITATTGEAESQITAAYKKMASASLELQNVQSRHNDILKNYKTSALDAATTTTMLTENLRENSTATKLLTAAKLELKAASNSGTEAELLFAGAEEKAADSGRHLTTSLYGAQGASRLLAGNVPTRAFERFLTLIPGVGAALSVAFPIIGAIALVEVIGEGIAKIHKMAEEADKAAEYIDRSFRKMGDSLREENDQLEVRFAHLEAQLDKAFQKPGANGAVEAFDEAAAAADRLGVSLDRDLEKLEELTSVENKKANIGFWASLFSGKAETGDTSAFLKKQVDSIRAVNDEYSDLVQRAADSGDKANLAQAQEAQLVHLEAAYKKASDAIVGDLKIVEDKQADFKESGVGEDQTAKINLLRGAYEQLGREQKNIGEQFANQNLETKVAATAKVPKENFQDELAVEQLAHGKSLGETVLYWEQVVAKTGKYHEQLLRAEEQFQKNLAEKGKFRAALAKDSDKEEAKPPAASNDVASDMAAYFNKTGEAYARYREEVEKGNQIFAENAAKLAEVNVQIREQSGAITKVQADHALGAIKAKEYADRIAELRTQFAALKADLPNQEAAGKGGEASAQLQGVQNQINQLSGQAAAAAVQNQGKTSQDISAPFVKGIDTINQAWLQMQNKLIFGTRNISMAFANMGVSMLESVAAGFEKMLVKQLQYEIQSRIAHAVSNQVNVANDATAAAESDAISKVSSIKQIFQAAKVAGAKAFKAYADVPPVPVVGALAAAGTFAAVLALGAFETGGIATKSGIYNLHEGEATLPRNLTSMLTSVANSSTSSTESSSFNQTNHYSGMSDRDFRQKIRQHSSAVADAVGREMRGGRRK